MIEYSTTTNCRGIRSGQLELQQPLQVSANGERPMCASSRSSHRDVGLAANIRPARVASGGEVDAGNQYDQDGDGHERRCSRAASPNPCSKIIGWQNFLKAVPPARPATGRSARSSPITTASPYTVLGSDIGSFSVVDSVPTIACHILVNGQLALCDWAFTEGRYGAVARRASPLTRALRVALPCRGDRP